MEWYGWYGNSINFVIEADGSLSLDLVDYSDSFAFELLSVDGNVYTFENADNALTLVINFDATYPEDTTLNLMKENMLLIISFVLLLGLL